jgi:hypothetical protein
MTEALQKPGGWLLEGSSYAPARLSQSATGLANRKRINVSPVPIADGLGERKNKKRTFVMPGA